MRVQRWLLLVLALVCLAPVWAAVEIVDLPDSVDDRYDLVWDVTVKKAPTAPLVLAVDRTGGTGYQLRFAAGQVAWQQLGGRAPLALAQTAFKWETGKTYLFSLKRRPGTVALLLNHRLVFQAPAPAVGKAMLEFAQVPAGLEIEEARYRPNSTLVFGDDFMRPESMRRVVLNGWTEDDTWKVAYYKRDQPVSDPKDPRTGLPMVNPWALSFYPVVQTTTNGFWYQYTGKGPSWVVANQTMVYPTWDRYFVEASIRTEYDAEVGLVAAYQDNKNYLLFRWRQRDYLKSGAARAELLAVTDGVEKVIASSTRGFDPVQWYQVRLNLGWQTAQVLIDGQVLLEGTNSGPVEGRIGLYANGAENPRRPKVDDVTKEMYVTVDENTGRKTNDAADALRTTSLVLFDDVRVGDWVGVLDLAHDSTYAKEITGAWKQDGEVLQAQATGRYLVGPASWSSYAATARVMITPRGNAGLFFHMDANDNGYAWVLSPTGQALHPVQRGKWLDAIDSTRVGVRPGTWATLRVEADGPYVALYCNGTRVMDCYNPARTAGRFGLLAPSAGAKFQVASVEVGEKKFHRLEVHEPFTKDKWLVIWSSAEADWYPSFTPAAYVTPAGLPHAQIGAAAPLPTNVAGLYWHKGGHYHDLRVTVPVSAQTLAGQTLHLSSNYEPTAGYRVTLEYVKSGGLATLWRKDERVGAYPFPVTAKSQLLFERRGSYLLLTAQELDPDETEGTPEVLNETMVFAYRDRAPLQAEMVGFTVTAASLPAAQVVVESDRIQDTFEKSPVGWLTESGVWAVMARYSCQPQWNWFGGFGQHTPTVWSKYRLDGDQTVEVYMGIKMQYDNAPEEYARRYRDTNVSICTDGSHLNSGYSLVRGGRPGGRTVTMLLRKGVVVQTSTEQQHLLPPQGQGHRQWFATRFEKRGKELKVFIDNRLAMTYVDPEPLSGGYVAAWTIDNGIMIGRANFSAERMAVGQPRAAAPLAVEQAMAPLPVPQVSVNGAPLPIATFEAGLDDWKERAGLTGRLVRERTSDPQRGTNTYLKVVNMYPAGDLSVSAATSGRNLAQTPILHFDYNFDPGVQVNLYARWQDTWYEVLLTGKEAQEANVVTAGRLSATADGAWHHLQANLGDLLTEAITKKTGKAPADLKIVEVVFADWSAPADMRMYGFGANPGGSAMRFDNLVFTPDGTRPLTLAWSVAELGETTWKLAVDGKNTTIPTQNTSAATYTTQPRAEAAFLHLQGKSADGKWTAALHVPIPGTK